MSARLLPVFGLALLGLLTSCDGDRAARAPDVEAVQAPPRPEALVTAEREIRGGQAAEAEARLRGWVAANLDSPFFREGQYLLGQARFAQRDYVGAKKFHDEVIETAPNRTIKALALFARAECNYQLADYRQASRQYHWLEEFYRDVNAVPHDELLFKLGMCCHYSGFPETADYWFDKVIELYATGPFAAQAREHHSRLSAAANGEPSYYSLEVASFTDPQKAQAEAEQFRQKGYRDVNVREVRMFGTPYYCVEIGKFGNRSDALRAKEDAGFAGLSASVRPGWANIPK